MQDDPPKPQAASDDRVIGTAFKVSLAVIVVTAAGLYAGFSWYEADPPAITPEAPLRGAQTTARPSASAIPKLPFEDVSISSGINFRHTTGAYGERLLPETMGAGAAFFDYDNDGDQDLLLVNGSTWPWRGERAPAGAKLYANRGDGAFDDVTAGSGLEQPGYGMGVTTADYDGDGFVDVFLTQVGPNRLFRNLGDGRFKDVSAAAGVTGAADAWSTAATFFDYDRDGDLDLYVGNYVQWSKSIDLEVDFRIAGIGRAYGPPSNYAGTQPYLYRNEGGGSFSDVTADAGLRVVNPATTAPVGKALAAIPIDIDGDDWLDLVVANDTVQNFAYRNLRNGRFDEIGISTGLAFDNEGAATGAMGMDVRRGGAGAGAGPIIAMGNFANEMTSFYASEDGGLFTDDAAISGVGPATRQALTFGLVFMDADLDGRLDLMQANGHLEHEINRVQASQHYRQPAQLFWNCGMTCPREYVSVPETHLGDLASPRVGRGLAYADVDSDGDLDALITQSGDMAVLLRNDQATGHHWIRVKLVGRDMNRDAIGASLVLHAGGREWHRTVMPTRSYLSQSELPVTFGIGTLTEADELTIRWPDGQIQTVRELAVDQQHVINQAR